ncbi:hypothetical protein [Nitrosomonas sp.]|uniref:hypothetical protein n=1 Tax=Nitrosomonas sp. TaxID=42353 RepID=UPI0025E5F291|nr:hypothetical protein [Nitrosomonas sp.]
MRHPADAAIAGRRCIHPVAADLIAFLKTDDIFQACFHQMLDCGEAGTTGADDCNAHFIVNSLSITLSGKDHSIVLNPVLNKRSDDCGAAQVRCSKRGNQLTLWFYIRNQIKIVLGGMAVARIH